MDDTDKTKVTVNLLPGDIDNLEFLADRFQSTRTDALRRALATHRFLVAEVDKKAKIYLERDGKSQQIILRDTWVKPVG